MSQPLQGKIKRLLADKNFGFIQTGDSDRKEYFFHKDDFIGHWDDLVTDFDTHQIDVEFHINAASTKGPRAANVKRLDYPNQAV